MPLGVQYFLLSLLIIGIVFLIIGVGIYAKWAILGPKFKLWLKKRMDSIKRPFDKSIPKIKKGAVISNPEIDTKLQRKIENASNPQELLEAQNAKADHESKIKELQQKQILKIEKKSSKDKKISLPKFGKKTKENLIPIETVTPKDKSEKSIDDLLSNVNVDETRIKEPKIDEFDNSKKVSNNEKSNE